MDVDGVNINQQTYLEGATFLGTYQKVFLGLYDWDDLWL